MVDASYTLRDFNKLITRRVRIKSGIAPQQYREQAVQQLTELANEAHKRATAKYLPTKDRQKWSRIAAYIHQTVNSLLKAYDNHVINEKLEELNRRVEELMEENQ